MGEIKTLEELKDAWKTVVDEELGGLEGLFGAMFFNPGYVKTTMKKAFYDRYGFKEELSNVIWTCLTSGKEEKVYKDMLESLLRDPKYRTQ